MNTIGFVISGKENEWRRALLPKDLARVANPAALYFERGYASHLRISDIEYERFGCCVASRERVYDCDIICNPKTPEDCERPLYHDGQALFGWIHAVQGRSIVDFLLERRMTAIAWEDMFEKGRHCFWRNNEIAGEAAVLHALPYFGLAAQGCEAAVIGLGNCGRGALKILSQLGARVTCFDRKTVGQLRCDLPRFDIVVNAVFWDVFREDHLLYCEDLQRMRPGSMIIDISCDEYMGIESSRPTTIADPVFEVDGILHYAVDHTPALLHRSATDAISEVVAAYIDQLVSGRLSPCLAKATVVSGGVILDERVKRFQHRESSAPLEVLQYDTV